MEVNQVISHSQEEVLDLLKNTEVSLFEDYGEFHLFILRRIDISESRSMIFPTEGFIIRDKEVFHFDRNTAQLTRIKSGMEGLLEKIEKFYHSNQKIIARFFVQVGKLEDLLFDRRPPGYFMDWWFDLKRELSKLKNYYFRNSMVYREFYKMDQDKFENLNDEFKDVEENIHFQLSNIDTLISRLDSVYNYYESIKADRLNKTLLTLTVISGIFLPLNLIVGFFGINTPGLFFLNDPQGSLKVLYVLGGVLGLCLLGFKILQLVDRFLLRYILGRYNFYNNLLSQIDDLSSRFRGR